MRSLTESESDGENDGEADFLGIPDPGVGPSGGQVSTGDPDQSLRGLADAAAEAVDEDVVLFGD